MVLMTMMESCKWLYGFQEKEAMEERLESSAGEGRLVVANNRSLSDWDVRSLLVDYNILRES